MEHRKAIVPFLLSVARFHAHGTIDGLADVPGPDWPRNVAASGMIGLAVHARRAAGLDVPDAASRLAVRDAGLHLRALADLGVASEALDAAGVRWMVLKGPVLTEVTYRVPGVRRYGDLDLLIHPCDFERGLDLLSDGPAKLVDRNWAMVNKLDRGEMVMLLRHGTVLDLHWHVINRPTNRVETSFDVLALFDRTQRIALQGMTIPTYDDVDRLIHVAVHAAQSGGHEVRWLLDVQQCAARIADRDPAEVAARSRELGGALCLRVMLERVARHLDPDVAVLADAVDVGTSWSVLCRVVDRAAALDADVGRFSGRVVYSATRRDVRRSTRALRSNAFVNWRLGRDRRTRLVDRAVLHSPGGTEVDRREWLDRVNAFGADI